MKLKWWAIAITVIGLVLSWVGSIPGITNLTAIYLGTFLVLVSIVLWLLVIIKKLTKR